MSLPDSTKNKKSKAGLSGFYGVAANGAGHFGLPYQHVVMVAGQNFVLSGRDRERGEDVGKCPKNGFVLLWCRASNIALVQLYLRERCYETTRKAGTLDFQEIPAFPGLSETKMWGE